MSRLTINKEGTEINKEFCIKQLEKLDFIEITNIDETPMPTFCAEGFFKSNKTYSEIREVIDSLRSRGYYMMAVIGIKKENSIIISYIYDR